MKKNQYKTALYFSDIVGYNRAPGPMGNSGPPQHGGMGGAGGGMPGYMQNYPPAAAGAQQGAPGAPYDGRPVGNHLPPGPGPGQPYPPYQYPGAGQPQQVTYNHKLHAFKTLLFLEF